MVKRQLQPLMMLLDKNNIKAIFAMEPKSRKKVPKEKSLGFIEYINPDYKEDTNGLDPKKYVKEIAQKKGQKLKKQAGAANTIIIGADTVVAIGSKILSKPKDDENAMTILKRLSGDKNVVVTGLVMLFPKRPDLFYSGKTIVEFGKLTDVQMRYYVKSGEAKTIGGYAIQGLAGTFIKGIEGDYFSVLGAPVDEICEE
ncbi:dTTP/UTP pyrophosphatase-like [Achroia grisella]|uniref:dTTP/UTP pyrophosphatase-like n=1 Tax=Achroia grisella TaxID=688607 RepID=UPI0027D27BCB|nr:dTTP/UTP pyrophosphatase-like [Achroia grisella]